MKIVEHTLKEELDNFFASAKIDRVGYEAYKAWPVICGIQLSAVTNLVNIKDGVLKVYTESSSAKTLLLLQKKKIISKYNEIFPNLGIVNLEIVKRT